MSEKLYTLTEEKLWNICRRFREFGPSEVEAILSTLPTVQSPVVPSRSQMESSIRASGMPFKAATDRAMGLALDSIFDLLARSTKEQKPVVPMDHEDLASSLDDALVAKYGNHWSQRNSQVELCRFAVAHLLAHTNQEQKPVVPSVEEIAESFKDFSANGPLTEEVLAFSKEMSSSLGGYWGASVEDMRIASGNFIAGWLRATAHLSRLAPGYREQLEGGHLGWTVDKVFKDRWEAIRIWRGKGYDKLLEDGHGITTKDVFMDGFEAGEKMATSPQSNNVREAVEGVCPSCDNNPNLEGYPDPDCFVCQGSGKHAPPPSDQAREAVDYIKKALQPDAEVSYKDALKVALAALSGEVKP